MAQTIYRYGTQERLETPLDILSWYPHVTALADGGWISLWLESPPNKGSSLWFQRYGADGNRVDGKVQVNTPSIDPDYRSGPFNQPKIAAMADGGWRVIWGAPIPDDTPNWQDDYVMYERRYNSDGVVKGPERIISSSSKGSKDTTAITTLDDGSYVVVWSEAAEYFGVQNLRQRHFDKEGNPLGAETTVNAYTDNIQYRPKVAPTKGGGWIVVWQSVGQDGDAGGIYQRHYNSNGSAASGERAVNITTADNQSIPDITMLADGGYVVTWQSNLQDGNGYGVYQRRYNSEGVASTGEIRVNTTTTNYQGDARVAVLPDGGWVVTWSGDYPGNALNYGAVYQQAYNSNGTRNGEETLVNIATTAKVRSAHLTGLRDGGWVVSYMMEEEGGAYQGIYQQRFLPNKAPSAVSLDSKTVQENAAGGAIVGTVFGKDANLSQGDALTYELRDNAGGRFVLEGRTLKVATGAVLDYEAAQSHKIVVRAKDKDYTFVDQTIIIQVADVADGGSTGSGSSRVLMGDAKANNLVGGVENNTIYGLGGNDILTGGAGHDIFVFDTKLGKTNKINNKTNLDKIVDYVVAEDDIWLNDAVFKATGLKSLAKSKKASEDKPVQLTSKFFKSFDSKKKPLKQDKDDYVLYDSKSGKLYYDADGKGGKDAIQIATLSKKLALTAKDFFVI